MPFWNWSGKVLSTNESHHSQADFGGESENLISQMKVRAWSDISDESETGQLKAADSKPAAQPPI